MNPTAIPTILRQTAQTRHVEQTRRFLESEGRAVEIGSPNPSLITAVLQVHHHHPDKLQVQFLVRINDLLKLTPNPEQGTPLESMYTFDRLQRTHPASFLISADIPFAQWKTLAAWVQEAVSADLGFLVSNSPLKTYERQLNPVPGTPVTMEFA